LAAAIAMAKGVTIGTLDKNGKMTKVYTQPPNGEFLKYLLDQFHGRAPSRSQSIGGEVPEKIVLTVEEYA